MPSYPELSVAPYLQERTAAAVPGAEEMSLLDVFDVLSRRKRTVWLTAAAVLATAIGVCATSPRQYQGSAEIQVQKEAVDALSLDNMISRSEAAPDSVDYNITLQTQVQILKSESVALNVIKTLNLEKTADFHTRLNPVSWALGLLTPKGTPDPKEATLEEAPARRSRAVKIFESHLKVKSVPGTRLIQVEYYSADPKIAAAVANLLVEDLVNYNFDTRHTATQQATHWLNNQLADLRKQSEDLQTQVVALQRDSGVFTLGQSDAQGREQVYAPVLDSLQQATSQLAAAQTSRIMKGALYQIVKDGDPELIAGLVGNGALAGASSSMSGSLNLLQQLRGQEAETKAQLEAMSAKFGAAYPKLGELQASLASTEGEIHAESARIAARAKNDYSMSVDVENKDRAAFEQLRGQAQGLNSKAVEYELVRQEASQSRTLYEDLLARLKEADLVAGLRSSNITPVDKAYVPSRPAKPNVLLYLAGGLGGGLLMGVCLAFYRDATNKKVDDLQSIVAMGIGAPVGLLPRFEAARKTHKRLGSSAAPMPAALGHVAPPPSVVEAVRLRSMAAIAEPRSAYTEALRGLRTTLLRGGNGPQVVLVTSSVPGEGKSMLSLNLAAVHAQAGKKVLLVDADLRTPVLHSRLAIEDENSLRALLNSQAGARTLGLPVDPLATLDFLPAGEAVADYPADLLSSSRFGELIREWRAHYDHIFLDGAPLLPVTDSAILSQHADVTLLVARHDVTDRRSLGRAWQILGAQGVRRPAIVLNDIEAHGEQQYSYYGYKPMGYPEGEVHA